MKFDVGDVVLLQGWRVGLIVAVSDKCYTDWVQVMFPDVGTAWMDSQRLNLL